MDKGRGGKRKRTGKFTRQLNDRQTRGFKKRLTSEKGYLLISTLFFLIFSGLFAQSLIKISGSQIIQMRQVSSAYQAKTALNMSKDLIQKEYIQNEAPKGGSIKTSMGEVRIERDEVEEEYIFMVTLRLKTGVQYSDTLKLSIPKIEEELEDEIDKELDLEDEDEETEAPETSENE